VLIIALIPFRVWIIPKWFSWDEISVLDEMTANSKAVLASLGGPPHFPGETHPQESGLERRYSEQKKGVSRQRAGSINR
jgi:hypothetical protein